MLFNLTDQFFLKFIFGFFTQKILDRFFLTFRHRDRFLAFRIRCIEAAAGNRGIASGKMSFLNDYHIEAALSCSYCSGKACTAGTDNNDVQG